MKKYKYAKANLPSLNSVEMFSTESDLIQSFLNSIKKSFPNSIVKILHNDLSGNPVYFIISGLSGKDFAVGTWVIQQLVKNGWEPFQSAHGDLHFRMEETDQ